MPLSRYFKYLHIFRPIKEFHVADRTSDSTRNVHNRGIYCIQYKHGSYSIVLELAASASSFERSIEMKRRLPMASHRVQAVRNRDGLARGSLTRRAFTRMPPTPPAAVEPEREMRSFPGDCKASERTGLTVGAPSPSPERAPRDEGNSRRVAQQLERSLTTQRISPPSQMTSGGRGLHP
jgi:hypothetical protein